MKNSKLHCKQEVDVRVTDISASTGRNDFIFDIYMALAW
jgi:hypothetical protein